MKSATLTGLAPSPGERTPFRARWKPPGNSGQVSTGARQAALGGLRAQREEQRAGTGLATAQGDLPASRCTRWSPQPWCTSKGPSELTPGRGGGRTMTPRAESRQPGQISTAEPGGSHSGTGTGVGETRGAHCMLRWLGSVAWEPHYAPSSDWRWSPQQGTLGSVICRSWQLPDQQGSPSPGGSHSAGVYAAPTSG